jgi:hypothetical protein
MRIARIVAAGTIAAGLAVASASATPTAHRSGAFLVGITDEAFTLYGDPISAFDTLTTLRAQVLRVNLYWGGTKWAVANKKPADPADPGDKAYDWSLYDRLVRYAANSNVRLVFSILFTPSWANHGAGRTHAPSSFDTLRDFAHAAAVRYSGDYTPPAWQQDASLGTATILPKVSMWTAWNEPNNPVWLTPQYTRIGDTWRIQSAYDYARICNAVYAGIHSVPGAGQVACGMTGPKGNDAPGTSRPSVDALTFLAAAHGFGMKRFDVYAHHPYGTAGNESPQYVPTGKAKRRIQLGNINVLLAEVTRFYGPKHLWITEYGYQTNPPDRTIEGTSWAKQALYLKQAYAIARNNPRIDMMLWFLVRDQPNIGGWQSGLETITGVHKPAWAAFQELPR